MSKIVCTGPIEKIAVDLLKPFGEIVVAQDDTEQTLLTLLSGAVVLVVRGEGKVNAKIIQEGRKDLKVIGRTGAGYDNVDIAAATAQKIPVVYVPGANSQAVAEAAITLMLVLCKRIFYWDHQFKHGNWQSRFQSKPGDLNGQTLGIIGLGKIGQALAKLIRPFNMSILAYDPYLSTNYASQLGIELVPLDVLLQKSDFISIHSPLNEQTRGLINRQRLKLVKQGSYLINLARGGIIDSLDVLYDAMKNGTLAGVGLDVFEPEPPDINHPIFKLFNCVTAPHALANTPSAMHKIFQSVSEDIIAVLKGARPQFVVNPEVFEC